MLVAARVLLQQLRHPMLLFAVLQPLRVCQAAAVAHPGVHEMQLPLGSKHQRVSGILNRTVPCHAPELTRPRMHAAVAAAVPGAVLDWAQLLG